MKRRQFLKIMGIALACIMISSVIGCSENNGVFTRHTYSDYEATVAVKGLKKTIRILHISDSHISIPDEAEKEFLPFSTRMDKAYVTKPHYKTGETTTPVEAFTELMNLAADRKVDMIALTGDIVNNPSKASVRYVTGSIQKTGIPYVFVAGNHDWHYEGMEGSLSELRLIWIQNSLLPLYDGKNPLFSSQITGGVNFVTIDNSTYQVTADQLDFYKKQAALNMPVVLLVHIPLYLPKDGEKENVGTCGDPRWGWDKDKNYKLEGRPRWPKSGNLSSTKEFLNAVKNTTNLTAVLAGHTHSPRADVISGSAVQYITGRSLDGQHRIVTFTALK